jgi:hypothetical protein
MMRRATALVALLMLVPVVGGAAPPALRQIFDELDRAIDTTPAAIAVSATGFEKSGRLYLRFTITNLSDKSFSYFFSRAPWGSGGTTTALLTSTGHVLRPSRHPTSIDIPFVSYSPPGIIVLEPGKSLSGDFSLPELEPLPVEPAGVRVAILWTYRLPLDESEDGPFRIYSGAATVERGEESREKSN